MELDIQEIFKSDLDPNSQVWWSEEKINKINYNFRQVALGGAAGPMGDAGYLGGSGVKGIEGPYGSQGFIGFQGHVGESPTEPWKKLKSDDLTRVTIFPKYNEEINGNEIDAIKVVFSEDIDSVGTIDVDLDGDIDSDDINTANSPLGFNDTVLLAYTTDVDQDPNNNRKNIELRYSNDPILGSDTINTGSLFLSSTLNESILNIESPGGITYGSNQLKLNISNDTYINIDSLNSIDFNVNTNIENSTNPITVSAEKSAHYGNTGFSASLITGKILSSDDTNGKVSWKNRWEVLGTYPIGTIVSIPIEFFNSSNFHLDENMDNPGSELLKLKFGAGLENTQYDGWYLANGNIWENESGGLQYNVPNLNQFEYSIYTNGDGQNTVNSTSIDSNIIIGGIDYSIDAEYTGNSSYFVDQEINHNDVTFNLGNTQGNLVVKRNIHLVYLRSTGLTWSTESSMSSTIDISLSYDATSGGSACQNISTSLFQLSGATINEFSDLGDSIQGAGLYVNSQTAQAGWYSNGSISRYWDTTQFTNAQICQVTGNFYAKYAVDVRDLNGDQTGGNLYGSDATSLKVATTLTLNGQPAIAGWYKAVVAVGQTEYYRRYWDGSQFIGIGIKEKYVQYYGYNKFSILLNPCSGSGDDWQLYAAFDIDPGPVPSPGSTISEIYNEGGKVYANQFFGPADSSGVSVGIFPLLRVIDQNAPGSNNPYITIFDGLQGGHYGILNTSTGKFYVPSSC